MLTQLAGAVAKLTGWLLGGVAAGAPAGSVLVCVIVLLAGPEAVLGLLAR